jgi:hypothetical protein
VGPRAKEVSIKCYVDGTNLQMAINKTNNMKNNDASLFTIVVII